MGNIMTCKINADTTDGLKIVSDTSGAVDIQSNGATKVTIDANGNVNTVGQVSTTDNGTIVTRQNAKPLIINGDMHVAQRATSVTGKTTDGYYTVDRMKNKLNDAGTYTISQSTDVPSGYGFTKSLKYDVTTAKDSPSAGTLGSLDYHVEAQDLQLLKYGTSSAQKLTFSFWVKSPKTGTHILSMTSPDGNRHIAKAYTVSSANTWENHICNFDGDTSGTINDDNGSGFQLQWLLVAGSNYQSGTLATSWASYTAANAYVGQVNCADNASNDFFITGIQMEIGEFTSSTIPSFQHESFGDSLIRCQRYCYKILNDTGSTKYTTIGLAQGTGRGYGVWQFTEMRTAPTVSLSNVAEFQPLNGAGAPQADFTTVTGANSTKTMMLFDLSGSSGLTSGQACAIGMKDGESILATAEL